MSNAIATQEKPFSLAPATFDQAVEFARMVARSNLAPKDFKGKPEDCLIAMQWGAEIGLQPLQALQNIAVINGRPALWGDTVIALVRASPLCEWIKEADDGHTATCTVKRRGEPEQARTFSDEDAKKAGLSGKQGPWTQYPKRMRQMRARAFALRDVFPDVLRGLPVAEEVMDIPTERHMGPAEEVKPAAPATYPTADFARYVDTWVKAVTGGRFTREQMLAHVQTKGALTPDQLADFDQRLNAAQPPAEPAPQAEPTALDRADGPTYAEIATQLHAAKDDEELALASSLINFVADEAQRAELAAIYEHRLENIPEAV